MNTRRTSVAAALGVPLLAALVAVPAQAQAQAPAGDRRVVIAGANAPGPDRLDKVFLRKYGPRSAKTILVLDPGSPGGQGNFAVLAPALVKRVPGLAVWSIDRRGNALEDVSGFRHDANTAGEYYFLGRSVDGSRFHAVSAKKAPYVRRWGAKVAIKDLHKVVGKARANGRRQVILGGHSMGAVTTPVYAVWDFAGRPGFKDLSGLLMIDGMELGAFTAYNKGTDYYPYWRTAREARRGLAAAGRTTPFGIAGPAMPVPLWTIGVLGELGCQYALDAPDAPSPLQAIIPADLRSLAGLPAFPVTNEAFFGVMTTSGLIPVFDMRTGSLAPSGNPRPWVNGRYSSVKRVCRTFTEEPGNGFEWYYPARLDHDLFQALQWLRPTAATRYLGLRPRHLARVDTPTFVFETSLSDGGVLRAAHRFIDRSNVREHVFASDQDMGHFDPLVDKPTNNKFVRTVVPWLRGIARH